MQLKRRAAEAWAQGTKATVFNCPEIHPNFSDLFAGIELSLMPLLSALRNQGGGPWVQAPWAECRTLLNDGTTLDSLLVMIVAPWDHPDMVPCQKLINFI